VDTILKNGDYARLGEADSKNSGLELEGYYSFLFGVIPDNDLQKRLGLLLTHDLKNEGRTLFCENFGFLPPPTRARKL
jgi:hypothetical protein